MKHLKIFKINLQNQSSNPNLITMMLPHIRRNSLLNTLQNLSIGLNNFNSMKLLWYPACGNDFRVLHHIVSNNIYVENDFFILSDMNNFEDDVLNTIAENNFFDIKENILINFPDLPNNVNCTYKEIKFHNGYNSVVKKCLMIWGITNQELYEIFSRVVEFKLETIFVKRCNDPIITENIKNLMNMFQCRYYINTFYQSGTLDQNSYNVALQFADNSNLLLRSISAYSGVSHREINQLEFAFTFENVLVMTK